MNCLSLNWVFSLIDFWVCIGFRYCTLDTKLWFDWIGLWFYVMEILIEYGYRCISWSCMSNQSNYENSLLSSTDTDRGISRMKFLKEGENCNIPALTGNPNCAGSRFWAQCVGYFVYWTENWTVLVLRDWLKLERVTSGFMSLENV